MMSFHHFPVRHVPVRHMAVCHMPVRHMQSSQITVTTTVGALSISFHCGDKKLLI